MLRLLLNTEIIFSVRCGTFPTSPHYRKSDTIKSQKMVAWPFVNQFSDLADTLTNR